MRPEEHEVKGDSVGPSGVGKIYMTYCKINYTISNNGRQRK
jgi:hypothetical protein